MRDRDVQQNAQQGGSLHTPTTDHNTQLRITAHAHDHHSSYSSRARVAIAMRLMFSVASSNHLVFAAFTGALDPTGCPWGERYTRKPLPELIQAWPTGSCGFPCAHMWQELVCGFQHGVGWQPGPTQRLQPSRGHWIRWPGRFVQRIDTRTAASWASRPLRLPRRGNAASSRRPGLRYVVHLRGLLVVCLTTGKSHMTWASRAHLVTAVRTGDLLLLANDG